MAVAVAGGWVAGMMDAVTVLSTSTLQAVTNGRATPDNTRVQAGNGEVLGISGMLQYALGIWPSRDNVCEWHVSHSSSTQLDTMSS